jgi:outer membrane protein assembly factor BamB
MRWFLLVPAVVAAMSGTISAANWPGFRGPTGDGVSLEKKLPLKWSATENVRWKTPLPEGGNSSPVVWGNRIFLTQAVDKGSRRLVMCFDRADGKVLWQRETRFQDKESTHSDNPYCSATPVTDGTRVIASHGSAGMVCYDFSGKELWRKDVGKLEHIWGNASSPILYGNLCILWCSPGPRQFLLAVDKSNGQTVWEFQEPGGMKVTTRILNPGPAPGPRQALSKPAITTN